MDSPASSSDRAVLETERLVLRRWRVGDAVVERRLWAERDPRVPPHRRMTPAGRPTLEELEERIRSGAPNASLGLLAAERRDTGHMIGYCGLLPDSHGHDGEPELAYEFLREEWHQGYATEAARAVLTWAERSGYRRLWATVREWNLASRRVMDRLGFVDTGRVDLDDRHGNSLFYAKDLLPPG